MSVTNSVGREQRQMQALCKANGSLVARFFGRIEMALNLYINVPFSKNREKLFDVPSGLFPQLVAGHQTTEVLVSGAVLGKQSQPDRSRRNLVWHPGRHACLSSAPFHGDFRAHMGANSCFLCRHVEARGAVDSIAVQQSDGWQLKSCRFANQVLGQGSALQETEC